MKENDGKVLYSSRRRVNTNNNYYFGRSVSDWMNSTLLPTLILKFCLAFHIDSWTLMTRLEYWVHTTTTTPAPLAIILLSKESLTIR